MKEIHKELNNKNILFLCVKTFRLEEQIQKKLESYGARVFFYDERLKDTNLNKAVIRIKKELYKTKIEKYYRKILLDTQNVQMDFLLVIRGEVVPEFFLNEFRDLHPKCTLIFYNWDSFSNTNNTAKLLHLYDRKFTFDPKDAVEFGINFRPLYYTENYSKIKKVDNFKYDLLFLGTAHSDRYIISSNIKAFLELNNMNAYCYYYMQSKWIYYFKKNFDKTFQHFDRKKISFTSLTSDDIIKLYQTSNVILDINHPNQMGLTMRTFEAIGAKRKLITTNHEIKKFDFYNPKNIYVLDRDNINVDLSFFDEPYEDIENDIYERLSISGWIYNLFVQDEKDYWIKFV